jgi:MFS transporter, ACS family, aldohexuronate transporter
MAVVPRGRAGNEEGRPRLIAPITFGLGYRRMRWLIAGWLTLSVVLNVVDKQTLSILAPVLSEKFHLSVQDYSHVVTAFLVSFTLMYAVGGRLVDWVGERLGMAACILWWSLCTMATALASGGLSLGAIRFLLGIGEPGNYPAALRACTRWFPKEERGLPVATFSSGGAVGNMIAPPLISAITLYLGWRAAFLLPGALGLVWLAGWLLIYRVPAEYPGITREELRALDTGAAGMRPPRWTALLTNRAVLALVLARLISDPVWYLYQFWIPVYLKQERGFTLADIGMYGWIPFVAGALGGMAGGRASDVLMRGGAPGAKARLRVRYLSSAVAPFGILITRVSSAAAAICLIAVVAFIVYSWFINTAAMIPDVVPENAVGSVLGIMGTAGSLGGALFQPLVGYLVAHYSFAPVFAMAGSMHVAGALVLWALMPGARAKSAIGGELHET